MLDLLTLFASTGLQNQVEETRKNGVNVYKEDEEVETDGVMANVADVLHSGLQTVECAVNEVYDNLTFAPPTVVAK